MLGVILKATNSSFRKSITFCRSIYVNKVIKLLTFIFEQPSYTQGEINSLFSALNLKIYDQHLLSLRAVGSFYFVH